MDLVEALETVLVGKPKRHPKCKGYSRYSPDGDDHGCEYDSTVECDDCRYLLENKGRGKDPEAACNQII